mmetsp:Transcript_14880/g.40766  ORF Transcript_14880/g.40766 Transcript_14880/m.40766 type:complete len:216 (-) Transcript_14880:2931-3578(-)
MGSSRHLGCALGSLVCLVNKAVACCAAAIDSWNKAGAGTKADAATRRLLPFPNARIGGGMSLQLPRGHRWQSHNRGGGALGGLSHWEIRCGIRPAATDSRTGAERGCCTGLWPKLAKDLGFAHVVRRLLIFPLLPKRINCPLVINGEPHGPVSLLLRIVAVIFNLFQGSRSCGGCSSHLSKFGLQPLQIVFLLGAFRLQTLQVFILFGTVGMRLQ